METKKNMACILARQGRERQRYENNVRLVSGCIPYRIAMDKEKCGNDLENMLQVLMVSSPNRTDLVFPKGGWEDDETMEEAACREALEEAGVKGILKEAQLGVWEFRSKSSQDPCSLEGGCKGFMFALQVTEELQTWPEQENRDRKWLNIKDAFELCRYEWMREALVEFLKIMSKEDTHDINEESASASVEPSCMTVAEVAECTMISSNCCIKPSSNQHHAINGMIMLPWQVVTESMPLI
ncbi:hypothetical protein K2173_028294 [Erythroxylum novogranatense]|uniref:Nudix hydrolase domain-containing protein n=1 Tax=Erythroxylum novogranatense TaxID=1862640 RepID=A0AAV8U1F1_9ROSI|nr:hypothetical protein K2173_028294 [Erythroxylum novogranatense]